MMNRSRLKKSDFIRVMPRSSFSSLYRARIQLGVLLGTLVFYIHVSSFNNSLYTEHLKNKNSDNERVN